jgi:hypothetical protein
VAERGVEDLDADLHGLRRRHLHLLHGQRLPRLPRHRRCNTAGAQQQQRSEPPDNRQSKTTQIEEANYSRRTFALDHLPGGRHCDSFGHSPIKHTRHSFTLADLLKLVRKKAGRRTVYILLGGQQQACKDAWQGRRKWGRGGQSKGSDFSKSCERNHVCRRISGPRRFPSLLGGFAGFPRSPILGLNRWQLHTGIFSFRSLYDLSYFFHVL